MRYRVAAVAVFLIASVIGGGLSATAATEAELRAQIESSNERIEEIRKEIEQLQKQLTTTAAERQTLQKAINELNLSIQKLQKDILLTQAQIDKKDLEIEDLSLTIDDTSTKISRSQEGVKAALKELHALDHTPVMLTLVSNGTLSSFFDQAVSLEALRTDLQNQIQDLSSLKDSLETNKSSAETKREELASLSEKLGDQRQGLGAARDTQSKLLQDTKSKEATYQAQIAQKQAEQRAFEAALFELASQLEYVLDPSRIPTAGKGILRWPLDSVFITQQFGRTSEAGRLYSSGTHDGMDFRAAIGTPIRAALSGTVMEVNHGAAPNCQYGKWVLVEHPNGLATLYAHLSQISVGKGEQVTTGKVVGYSGNTGYATGPHLHFTVYFADAISLRQYTCRSGAVVTIPIAPPNAYLNPLSYLPAL